MSPLDLVAVVNFVVTPLLEAFGLSAAMLSTAFSIDSGVGCTYSCETSTVECPINFMIVKAFWGSSLSWSCGGLRRRPRGL